MTNQKQLLKPVLFRETGESHRAVGKPCEDAVFTATDNESGVCAIALSDGVGSCPRAGVGSQVTAKIAAEFTAHGFEELWQTDDEAVGRLVLRAVQIALLKTASEEGQSPADYSATLLLSARHPDGRTLLLHIGDGAIVGVNASGGGTLLSAYEHEGAVNETDVVTMRNPSVRVSRFLRDKSSVAIVLMSDGPEEFLTGDDGVSPRVGLMAQLSCFCHDMDGQFRSLMTLLKKHGMEDDASFAVMVDRTCLRDIWNGLGALRPLLFPEVSRGERRVLDTLSNRPRGMTSRDISRALYLHSPTIAHRRADNLKDVGLVSDRYGVFTLCG